MGIVLPKTQPGMCMEILSQRLSTILLGGLQHCDRKVATEENLSFSIIDYFNTACFILSVSLSVSLSLSLSLSLSAYFSEYCMDPSTLNNAPPVTSKDVVMAINALCGEANRRFHPV